jgi:hypothetical protein
MRSRNSLPQIKQNILAQLATNPVVRIKSERPRKLVRELRKELQMCSFKIENEYEGIVAARWKDV